MVATLAEGGKSRYDDWDPRGGKQWRDSDYSISAIYNTLCVQDASAEAINARGTLDPRNS
jgi:hypothetical protein